MRRFLSTGFVVFVVSPKMAFFVFSAGFPASHGYLRFDNGLCTLGYPVKDSESRARVCYSLFPLFCGQWQLYIMVSGN